MKCDLCAEKATVFYTQVSDGKMKKTALCESCAQKQGITDPSGLLMAEQLMAGLPVVQGAKEPESLPLQESATECATCHFTLEDYRKIGRLGCGDCYLSFAQEIEQRLPSLHKGLEHQGRAPEGIMEQEQKRTLIDGLNERLKKAIKIEDYETAAKIRDELQLTTENLEKEDSAS